MRAFVTGGTGLLGSNLIAALVHGGASVRALVRSPDKARAQLGALDNVQVVQGDLSDVDAFAEHLAGVDVVFHTAAYFREYYGSGDHEAMLQRLNVDATVALARAAHAAGVRRFVHTSSSGTIGLSADGAPATEANVQDPSDMTNLYFRSKVLADEALAQVVAETGLDVVTVLPGWMFGPGDAGPTASGQLVLDFLSGALPPISIPGGAAVADARDVADAMVRMADHATAGDRFIVAGPHRSLREIIDTLAEITGGRGPWFTLPYPLALAFAAASEAGARLRGKDALISVLAVKTMNSGHRLSSAHAEQSLGVRFRPLRETLSDSVTWVRAQQARPVGQSEIQGVAAT